jgi:hypothetical protein
VLGRKTDAMRRTRAAYHYVAIRRTKRQEESIICQKVANALIGEGGRNFWAQIKGIRGKTTDTSNSNDGLTEVEEIAKFLGSCTLASHTTTRRLKL